MVDLVYVVLRIVYDGKGRKMRVYTDMRLQLFSKWKEFECEKEFFSKEAFLLDLTHESVLYHGITLDS